MKGTLVQYYYLPTIRAAIKLFENDPARAIEVLRPAEKYVLVSPQQYIGGVYSAYIRGLAYIKMGEGRPAAVEFQKLLDHPPIVGRFVTGALAHLQLGRAQAMMGDKEAARKSYHDFLDIWKGRRSRYTDLEASQIRIRSAPMSLVAGRRQTGYHVSLRQAYMNWSVDNC